MTRPIVVEGARARGHADDPADDGEGLGSSPSRRPAQTASTSPKANYELAANWTALKVWRLVFDTTVTPRWLEAWRTR